MKFYRWFEDRLSSKKKKNKTRCKQRTQTTNEDAFLLDMNCETQNSHSNSGQISIQKSTAKNHHRISTPNLGAVSLMDNDTIPSSPSLLVGTPSLGRQRSRIKTNPWLRSPWLQARTSYSSSSTDSGCVTLNNECQTITAPNSLNFGFSSNSIDSQSKETQRQKQEEDNDDDDDDEKDNEKGDELDQRVRNPVMPCSSSDEFVSSASSSSVFSSRSSSLSSDPSADANWSALSHPSAISLLSSEAIPMSPWSLSQASSGSLTNDDRCENRLNNQPLSERFQRTSNGRSNNRKFAQANKRRFLPVYSKYARFGRNEHWVSMATDLISLSSSSEDDEECLINDHREDNDVPSPAPPEPLRLHYSSLNNNNSETANHWNLNLRPESNVNLNVNSVRLNSSLRIDSCTQLHTPVSPLTADSGLGLSEGSISTTPSTDDNGNGNSKVNAAFEDKQLTYLNEKVKRLRVELKNIVNVAIKEAREEEMRMREERIAYLREMIEFKRLILIQSLDELRHRIDGNAFY